MPNWKKLITSGSNASLNNLNVAQLTASGLNYPSSDGSANQVLSTDGSGNLSFVAVGAANLPDGVISSSAQIVSGLSNQDVDFGTGDITANSFTGDGSGLTGISATVPAGTVSSSAQIDHDATTNFSADEHFTQANITTVGTVTSGDVSGILPSGVVSSSAQTVANLSNQDVDFGTGDVTATTGSFDILGVGTASPDGLLNLAHQSSSGTLSDDAGGYALTLNFEGATNDYGRHIAIRDTNGDAVSAIGGFDEGTGGATALYFATGNTTSIAERMRINSSGTVLVGKTVDGLATAGTSLFASGVTYHTTAGVITQYLNRTTSDGPILEFRKDNSTVGRIGTIAGDLTIGDADVAIRFDTGTGLVPWNISTNLATNNAIDIGVSSAKFKDLYLGGTGYIDGDLTVGGTVTAQEFHTEFVSASIIYTSGSTKFGDTSDDIHSFSGSLRVTGSGDHYFTNGNVGIGTTSPGTVLDIHGTGNVLHVGTGTNVAQYMSFRGSGGSGAYIGYDGVGMMLQPGDGKRFLIRGGNATWGSGTAALAVDTSGNVGIGTTSPQALLHVEGALSASGQITAADIVPYADDTEFLGGSANRWRVLYATRIQTDILREADGTNVLGMTGTTRDLYGTDGNVRISFEDDITLLNGDLVVPEYIYHGGDTDTFIRFQTDDINLTAGGSNLFRVDNTAPVKEIVVNEAGAATNFRVESDAITAALFVTASTGNVGIGTTSPSATLHVNKSAVGEYLRVGSGNIRQLKFTSFDTVSEHAGHDIDASSSNGVITLSTGGTERMRIDSSGNVGIGTDSPSAVGSRTTLNISGSAGAAIRLSDDTANTFLDYTDGSGARLSVNAAEPLTLRTNSSDRVTIDSSGRVGIGVADPAVELEVGGSTNTQILISTTNDTGNSQLYFGDSDSDSSGIILYRHANDSMAFEVGGAERMRISGSGNVGIGTTTPSQALHVSGKVRATSWFTGTDDTNTLFSSTSAGTILQTPGLTADNNNSKIFFRHSGGTNKFTFDNNAGSLGIGTESPSNSLHLSSSAAAIRISSIAGGANIYLESASGNNSRVRYNSSTGYFALRDDNASSDVFVISGSNGNVGIGTTSPARTLHVSSGATNEVARFESTDTEVTLEFKDTTGTSKIKSRADFRFETGATPTEAMRIDSSGNVGIGTTSPTASLHVEGVGYFDGGENISFSDTVTDAAIVIRENDFIYTRDGNNLRRLIGKDSSDVIHIGAVGTSLIDEIRLLPGTTGGKTTFYDNSTQIMVVSGSGVGIGTTSPSTKLHVKDTNEILRIEDSSSTGNPYLSFYQNGTRRSFVQHVDGNDTLSLVSEYGDFRVMTGTSGTEVERLRIDSSGNVGIGTTSPGNVLHISGSNNSTPVRFEIGEDANYYFKANSTSGYATTFNMDNTGLDIGHNSSGRALNLQTNSQDRLTILGGGNVGIGTTSPDTLLEIVGADPILTIRDSGTSLASAKAFLRLAESGASDTLNRYVQVALSGSASGTNLTFDLDGNEKMRINESGNVGIGTTSPLSLLHLEDASSPTVRIKDTTNNVTLLAYAQNSDAHIGTYSNHDLIFDTNSTERLRIDNSGNVGIGTTSPSANLHVVREITTTGIEYPLTVSGQDTGNDIDQGTNSGIGLKLEIAGNDTAGDSFVGASIVAMRESTSDPDSSAGLAFLISQNDTTLDEAVRIDHDGNVGIGTTSPGALLELRESSNAAGDAVIRLRGHGLNADNTVLGAVEWFNADSSGDQPGVVARVEAQSGNANGHMGELVFKTHDGSEGGEGSDPVERMRIDATGGVNIVGALTKGSGAFKIDHPLESKRDTHHLVHSFVESPQANNIYRGFVTLSDGQATVNLDEVSGMTDGTFVLLNTNIHVYTSNESDWDAVKGSVSDNVLTIECQNSSSTAKVNWLVIGERHDQHMMDTDLTDENGKVIVEPLK